MATQIQILTGSAQHVASRQAVLINGMQGWTHSILHSFTIRDPQDWVEGWSSNANDPGWTPNPRPGDLCVVLLFQMP
ncbi:MAG: hypothetical protein NW204_06295 [Xanthomonadaceae bacterium]|nr:hypothetical protein [Xanthomonadaceae bacterium]